MVNVELKMCHLYLFLFYSFSRRYFLTGLQLPYRCDSLSGVVRDVDNRLASCWLTVPRESADYVLPKETSE